MIAPDRECITAPGGRGNESSLRTNRRRIGRAIFFLALGAVLYLALIPNYRRPQFRIVPQPVYRWFAEHDDFNNIVAFAVLAIAAFLLGRHPANQENAGILGMFARRFASRTARLASLLTMVCVLEILQRWIPGRVSEMQDVCTGCSGIFAAWLLSVLWDARAKPLTPAVSAMD